MKPKKRRNFLSVVLAVLIVVGLSQMYRPHLDTRLGAAIDLALVIILFFVIRAVFAKFEAGFEDN